MFSKRFKNLIYRADSTVILTNIRYLPRWVVLVIDMFLTFLAIFFSCYVIEKLTFSSQLVFFDKNLVYFTIIGIAALYMFLFRTFTGIVRYSTFIDLFKLFIATFCTTVTFGSLSLVYYVVTDYRLINMLIPFSVLFFATSFLLLVTFRLAIKELFHYAREFHRSNLRKQIWVLGTDQQAVAIARAILDNPAIPFHIAGFLTDRNDTSRARLLGKPIYSKERLEKYTTEELRLEGVLIVKEMLTKKELNQWVAYFLEKDLLVYKAPTVQQLLTDDGHASIKAFQIEDLLNRKPIKIENKQIRRSHEGKMILITGGAGSIGSEIVRQVVQFDPALVVVLDQAETPLHEMELEMRDSHPQIKFKFVLANISNRHRLEPLFQQYQFSIVYHAAAYKHVPMIEENPHEAILVNILGSKNLAVLASTYNVERFVMISTDKAVNPTNVMGASKRTAELFVKSLQTVDGNATKFITTRFGNVLGSNGSVIPHFKKQIEKGGPVTITHPDIVRYFMTIPEACELVLQAGTMGDGGEIFVFDMGEPVKILDLAIRMIKLSRLEPGTDIKIVYSGLRPGEKLYEELLTDGAKTLPTHHEKIMISKETGSSYDEIDGLTNKIVKSAMRRDKVDVVTNLKVIVPEFISNNSIYEELD